MHSLKKQANIYACQWERKMLSIFVIFKYAAEGKTASRFETLGTASKVF